MSEPVTAEQAPRDGWRHLLVMLAVVAVGFLGQPDPAAAQVQTYYYQGPAFDIATCEPHGQSRSALHQRFSQRVCHPAGAPAYTGSFTEDQRLVLVDERKRSAA